MTEIEADISCRYCQHMRICRVYEALEYCRDEFAECQITDEPVTSWVDYWIREIGEVCDYFKLNAYVQSDIERALSAGEDVEISEKVRGYIQKHPLPKIETMSIDVDEP